MRDIINVEVDGNERVCLRVGNVVDRDDVCRARESLNGVGSRGHRHDGGGPCIAERYFETFSVTLEFRREQRHRDGARLDRGEEPGDVVEALWGEDRHPVPSRGDTLHARANGPHPATELGPGQFDGLSVDGAGEVQVAKGHGVTHMRDVAVDERYQRDAWWQLDAALGIEAVLDLQQTLRGHQTSR
jgi:hypothetical protein